MRSLGVSEGHHANAGQRDQYVNDRQQWGPGLGRGRQIAVAAGHRSSGENTQCRKKSLHHRHPIKSYTTGPGISTFQAEQSPVRAPPGCPSSRRVHRKVAMSLARSANAADGMLNVFHLALRGREAAT